MPHHRRIRRHHPSSEDLVAHKSAAVQERRQGENGHDARQALILGLQHTAGNRAVQQMLQRTPDGKNGVSGAVVQRQPTDPSIINDWENESDVKGTFGVKSRTKALKSLDLAVANFAKISVGELDKRIAAGTAALAAVDAWSSSKKSPDASIRAVKIAELVKALTDEVQAASDKKDAREKEMVVAKQRFSEFQEMEPEMKAYAGRDTNIKDERFAASSLPAGGLFDLLSRPKGPGGALSQDVINSMITGDQDRYLKKAQDTAATKGSLTAPEGIKPDEIRALMERYKNKYTGETEYPELENLLNPSGEKDEVKSEARNVGGVAVTVQYNPSDAMFANRWGLVESAINLVKLAGFDVPNLKLFLPKYGRSISVSASEQHTHEVNVGDETEAAMFVVPNNVYMSSRTFKNPKVDTGLSVKLDPSGVATIIHELGHFMHFQSSPSKFFNLSLSILAGASPEGGGERLKEYAARVISQYGSNNPREFVAEVFLGLVYKKTFPDAVMKIYAAFGGPIPANKVDASKKWMV